ncbi:MAG: HAMP domain-containing sensor histidine kinase [Rhodoferax sp.]|nr:HAMP domain-containing sensor histidine kinase [Rhodoferax sp.]
MSLFFKKLYVRIWLAVVLAVAVLTFLVGLAWRLAADPPLREVVVRNEAGHIIGSGRARLQRPPEAGASAPDPSADEATDAGVALGQRHRPGSWGKVGSGPQFVVRMEDGQTVHMHLPRPPPSSWGRAPFGFFWTLTLVAIAVALATYPIIRTLTRRLERLQDGVQKWGEGDLTIRVAEVGQDEVAFLAKRFNIAAERVETLVKSQEALLASQKSLLANASHELRSPLTRIRMGLELMGERASTQPAASPGWRREIERNIAELDQLIEEILLASRLDAREADMGTVEPVDLIGLVAEECAHCGAELDVQLESAPDTPDLQVQGVAKLLHRVVRNLLENARRHAAGEITVTLGKEQGRAVIRVCDRGPGVPAGLRERIFEPFYRLPGATERDGGVGLGLALVKSIAIRHGGTAHCENRPDGGACFVVQLPLA